MLSTPWWGSQIVEAFGQISCVGVVHNLIICEYKLIQARLCHIR